MDDTISRAAVVDAIEGVDWYHINKNGEMVHGANDNDHQAWYKAEDIYKAVESVPSAQPVAKDINVSVKDCISRQTALDALYDWSEHSMTDAEAWHIRQVIGDIKSMPSAQQWIPCSERLPEEYGEYRITWTTSASKKRFVGDAEYEVTDEWNDKRNGFKGEWLLDDYIKAYPDVKVIAWKPIEEPYRGR